MYNLNVNVATAAANSSSAVNNLLAVENSATTPRTPEILNTLIALTNPLDSYNFNESSQSRAAKSSAHNSSAFAHSNDSNSSGSHTESPTSPPSVQHTCSQLIKAGLKLSIQSKRKLSSGDSSNGNGTCSDLLDLDNVKKRKIKGEVTGSEDEYETIISPPQGLTPEDEERRRRRRERNKIAATKCRLKKREKTVNLVHESETLETQNIELKTQIQQLESQRRRLVDMLSMHSSTCVKHPSATQPITATTATSPCAAASTTTSASQPPYDSLVITGDDTYLNSTFDDANLDSCTYTRATSVDIPLSYSHLETSYGGSTDADEYNLKPIIIVNESDDANYAGSTQLTDLDSPNSPYQTNFNCHNNYSSPRHSQNAQSYTATTGLDNGCMA